MGLLSIFQKKPKFAPTNVIEEMLEKSGNDERLLDLLVTRQLVLIIAEDSDVENGRLRIPTNAVDGANYAYVYTSVEALTFVSKQQRRAIDFVEIGAGDLFQTLIDSNFGFILNANTDGLVVFRPDGVLQLRDRVKLPKV